MLKKKIASVVAAMAMAATMSVSALSASAACVKDVSNNCVGDGGFYTYWEDINNDNVIDWDDAEPAPKGMYDCNISSAIQQNDGTVLVTLVEGTITINSNMSAVGYISQIDRINNDDTLTNVYTGNASGGTVYLDPNETYRIHVVATKMIINGLTINIIDYEHGVYDVEFRIGDCNCSNCNC